MTLRTVNCVALLLLSCAGSPNTPRAPIENQSPPRAPIEQQSTPPPSENPEAPRSSDQNLPHQLEPRDIQRNMVRIKGRVQDCYAQFNVPGMVKVIFTIEPSGQVSSAEAIDEFVATPTGICIAAAVKDASFPSFSGPAMTGIVYPFMLSK